jgi:hypothetical protein
LERVRLADGTRLVVKRATGEGVGRELGLWRAGALDEAGHCIVDGWLEGDVVVTVMVDLADAVGSWERRLSRPDCRRVLTALVDLHQRFSGVARGHLGLLPLVQRVTLLWPDRPAWLPPDLSALVTRGWEHFAEVAPADVVEAVGALHRDPPGLAARMAQFPLTLVHGDMTIVNLALTPERVVFLDWGLASEAPGALDLGSLLISSASHLDATPDELVADYRRLRGAHDPGEIDLCLLWALTELGWNKALDIVEHPDPALRRREQADLDWWVATARRVLESCGWV